MSKYVVYPEERRAESLRMMRSVMEWPRPLLPMKRAPAEGGLPECGLYLPNRFNPDANLFDLASVKTEDFIDATPEQLVQDGWVVD